MDLEKEKRAAVKYVSVSKSKTEIPTRVDIGSVQEVTTSKMKDGTQTQTARKPSPKEQLTSYLKSIGMQ
jgi:hypothetical protein